MLSSRQSRSLEGTTVLALGSAIATRVAAAWLADSGATVALFRPGWQSPAANSTAERFEQQVGRNTRPANFEQDAPYDLLITASTSASLCAAVPANLLATAAIIEITAPVADTAGFDDSLIRDMTLWARSGLGYLTREIGPDWEPAAPCLPLNRQPAILAGIAAATAAVGALLEDRPADQPPRHICIDQLELLAIMPMQPIAFAQMDGRIVGAPTTANVRFPGGTVETANGMAYVRPVEPAHWAKLLRVVGELDTFADQVEQSPRILWDSAVVIDTRIRQWARSLTSEDIADRCQAEHVPVGPVYRPEQVVADTHLNARGFFRHGPGPDTGINPPWLAAMGEPAAAARTGHGGVRPQNPRLPLSGLRILDLSWAWAGPFATTLLSDLGAEVINVEWHPRASNLRRNAPFANNRNTSNNTAVWWSANQRGKFSIGVDLKSAAGKQVIRDLAAESDAVVENFSPGVVSRLGVGFDDLLPANPRLVYVSLSAFGQTGPRSHYVGYGTQVYAAAGAGYATAACSQMAIPYPDPVSGLVGAYAIASFIRNARQTGRPARIDISEVEAVGAILLECLLDALADRPAANPASDATARVQQVVETADGRYVVLLARSATDWRGFQQALGATSHAAEAIAAAAKRMDCASLLRWVDAALLYAAVIADSADVLQDPYLRARGFWVPDTSPEVAGTGTLIGGSLWQVDSQRTPIWRGAPPLFGDTRRVLQDLLGYETPQVDELFTRGDVA